MSLPMDHESWDRISLLSPGCIPRLFYSLYNFLYSLANNSKAPRCSSAWQSSDIEFQLFHIPVLIFFLGKLVCSFRELLKNCCLGLFSLCFLCCSLHCGQTCMEITPKLSTVSNSPAHNFNTDSSRPEQKVTLQRLEFLSKARTAAPSTFFDISWVIEYFSLQEALP